MTCADLNTRVGSRPWQNSTYRCSGFGTQGLGFGELICNHPHPPLLNVPHDMTLNPKYSVTSYLAGRVVEGVYEGYGSFPKLLFPKWGKFI